jgi:hypothetical protein
MKIFLVVVAALTVLARGFILQEVIDSAERVQLG